MDHDFLLQNQLLRRLPVDQQSRIANVVRRVMLVAGEVASEPGRPIRFVYFPTTGVLSSVVALENGAVAEAATIGNEGMAGIESVVAERGSPYRVVARIEGEVLRMHAEDFRSALAASPALREIIGRYALTVLQQLAQNTACHLHHNIEERMSRWLLATSDRVGRNGFRVTQEFLGEMLGVSRQSVNTTAGQLQEAGLIAYRRGNLQITDRLRLEAAACECYRATKQAYERLMRSEAA
jgi:CRP-like cAMP-binding protein